MFINGNILLTNDKADADIKLLIGCDYMYNFEHEGSKSVVERIWKNLETQYNDMLAYADKYNLVIDETLDTFDKFVELFDSEYYNCGNFNSFECPQVDYTLLVDKLISVDTVLFLPKSLANQFNVLEIHKHYSPMTRTYFDSLIANYLENYHLILDNYGEWLNLEIEGWITENSVGRDISSNRMNYDKATTEKLKRKQMEENIKTNLVKQLKAILHDFNSVLSDEDHNTIENIINRYQ
ncbi:hypothetical protein [Romboutsia ilealis]|uniref:hypothetical protein n=1 Tax=Romboutsia ilealis TaxID=1115758 RepID=UPI002676103E|nr:hypothetical protein [Romboutsia ilealis]